MALDWNSDALAEGLRCYCREEFFLAHEHWESTWLRCEGAEKTFLQALIQLSAAFHHLQRRNRLGAISLLRTALRRLEAYPAEYGGITVEPVRESARAWLQALEHDEQPPALLFPRIQCIPPIGA